MYAVGFMIMHHQVVWPCDSYPAHSGSAADSSRDRFPACCCCIFQRNACSREAADKLVRACSSEWCEGRGRHNTHSRMKQREEVGAWTTMAAELQHVTPKLYIMQLYHAMGRPRTSTTCDGSRLRRHRTRRQERVPHTFCWSEKPTTGTRKP